MSMDVYMALRCFLLDMSDLTTYSVSTDFDSIGKLQNLPHGPNPECFHVNEDTRICRVGSGTLNSMQCLLTAALLCPSHDVLYLTSTY
jgi:hypothetical protein